MQPPIRKTLTIAIPVYNEGDNLPAVFSRVDTVMASYPRLSFEVLLIDNHSTDNSSQLCLDKSQANPTYKYVRFSRNFGIEASFHAGLSMAKGDALIYLFSDLQDPPELIPEFIKKWEEGYDLVYGELKKREDQSIFKSLGAYVAYRLIERLSDVVIPRNATDFRLMSRPVIEALLKCGEHNRYMRGLTHWVGFKSCSIPFERVPRKHGVSKAGFWWCVRYAFNAILSFSTKPLKLASLVGLGMTSLSLAGIAIYLLHLSLARLGLNYGITPPPPGWTTLVLLGFLFGGINCLLLGIIGEYIAQIHSEIKARPQFIVETSKNT